MPETVNSLLFSALAVCLAGPLAAAQVRPPNIILFLIDDQDKESIGAYGGKTYTPTLDRLAREGMKFTHAYVSSAVCTPSRYTFATGRYAGNSTSQLYADACGGADRQGNPNFNMALERDGMNVGHVLSAAGYTTGWVGKFHLESAVDFPEFFSGEDGFKNSEKSDALQAGPEATALFAHNERVLRRYLNALGFSWAKHVYRGNLEEPYESHNAEWTTAAALEFIELNRNRPFYLHYCTTLLHGPERSWRRSMDHPLVSGAGLLAEPAQGMTPRAEILKQVAAQGLSPDGRAAGEAWVDDALGAILRKLKELGLDDNTIVLFTPDHGSSHKSSLFTQDGVGVPMIVRWPGHVPAGVTSHALVGNVDWVPTVFEIAGVRPPPGYRLDGHSVLPVLTGKAQESPRDHVYLEMGHARGVATREWKYIAVRYPQEQINVIKRARPEALPKAMSYIGRLGIGVRGADRPGFWDADQLYDLTNDPEERVNLAADPKHAGQLQKMRAMLTAELLSSGRPFGEFVPGGNAAAPGQIDAEIAQVKKLLVQGKTVTVPDEAKAGDEPASPPADKPGRKKKKNND